MKGVVVRVEPGKLMVVRGPDMKEVTYMLSPSFTMPADVVVGRTVEFDTEQGTGETWVVTKVTTIANPDGTVERTTEKTTTYPSGAMTTTTTTTIDGVVETYVAGKTLTLTRPDGTRVTYVINDRSNIPADLAVGKRVVIQPVPLTGSSDLAVAKVTYTTKTKTKDGETVTKTKTKVKEEHEH